MTSTKRPLPLLPHPDHLRKQAKARLAAMREKSPTARLADAQSVLAQEYGFAHWGALQAEVTRRTKGPRNVSANLRRADLTPLHSRRFEEAPDPDTHTPTDFFRMGLAAQIAFIFAALAGMALVLVPMGPPHGVMATALRLWQPLCDLIHRIFQA